MNLSFHGNLMVCKARANYLRLLGAIGVVRDRYRAGGAANWVGSARMHSALTSFARGVAKHLGVTLPRLCRNKPSSGSNVIFELLIMRRLRWQRARMQWRVCLSWSLSG